MIRFASNQSSFVSRPNPSAITKGNGQHRATGQEAIAGTRLNGVAMRLAVAGNRRRQTAGLEARRTRRKQRARLRRAARGRAPARARFEWGAKREWLAGQGGEEASK